jgi:hypothetical protein
MAKIFLILLRLCFEYCVCVYVYICVFVSVEIRPVLCVSLLYLYVCVCSRVGADKEIIVCDLISPSYSHPQGDKNFILFPPSYSDHINLGLRKIPS